MTPQCRSAGTMERLFSVSGSGTVFIQGHSSFKYWITFQVLKYAYFLGG